MPELPEVETIKRDLESSLRGLYLESLDIIDSSVCRNSGSKAAKLIGKQVKNISRRGKFLFFEFTGETYLLLHLGMTGKLHTSGVCNTGKVNGRMPRVKFKFHDGCKKTIFVDFIDTRRFGKLRILNVTEKNRFDDVLGMEPLSSKCTPGYLNDKFKTRRAPVHAVLLDQKLIAGVGNIYATEALHIAGIHPERTASGLGHLKTKELFNSLKYVLKLGIKRRGSSIRDYVDAYGNPGTMQNYFKVYGRTICSNPRCKAVLERIVIRGRGVRFCPECQK